MAMTPKSIPNSHRALDQLRQMIFDGTLSPGSDHLETELALRLGMSRTPVREALLTLEAQGLVEIRPRRGVRIITTQLEDMREVYDVLTAIESLAAARLAERALEPEDLAHLEQALTDMEAALEDEDLNAWAEADDRFHTSLVALSGNSRIASIAAMMRDQVHRARYLTLRLRPIPTQSNIDHRNILDAIRAGEVDKARELYREHGERARETLLGLLDSLHLRKV